jgi:hypothetical protein
MLVQLVVVLGDVMAEVAPGGCVHGAAVSVWVRVRVRVLV